MANVVDDRVVAMSFENSKFQTGAAETLGTLGKLKAALGFSGASKGLSELEGQVGRFGLGGFTSKIEGASHAFGAMKVAGITAVATITNRAVSAGINFAKAFTIDPIKEGFKSYEEQINAVQTIMANTGLKGKQGLSQVNGVLKDLQHYANLTVYNFADMAKNIGTFTAAGVDLKTSAESIKGIANLAALSGSTSQQASSAMYQLSQAIAAGQVHLQDWNSVVNAGIGGKVFQNALVQTGLAMGTLSKGAVKTVGPMKSLTINGLAFRNSLTPKPGQASWLTSSVLTTALGNFTGDLSKAQLKAKGFTDSQIKLIQTQATTAVNAATKIKTFSQLTQALKEEVATAYGAIFKTLFGNITDATSLFSALHTHIENAITNPLYKFNNLLEAAVKLGARTDIIKGFKNIVAGLSSVIKPIKEAFKDIFPASTAREIANFAKSFRDFTSGLKVGSKTADEIKRTFQGVFAVFDIGKQIISGIIHVFFDLFKSMGKSSGGFLSITASIGDFITGLDKSLKKGNTLTHFFETLGKIVQAFVHILSAVPALIGGLFTGFHIGDSNKVTSAFSGIGAGAQDVQKKLTAVGDKIHTFFHNLGQSIGHALSGVNWQNALDAIDTGFLGGVFLLIKKFTSKGIQVNFAKGLLGNVSESFEALTGRLKSMQQNVQADTLQKIAIAVGILAASLVALSLVDGAKLERSLKAVGVAMAELLGALKILGTMTEGGGFAKLPIVAGSLILIAGAVDTLVIAVVALSRLSWDRLKKGLTGVGVLLGELSLAVKPLSAGSAGLIRAGIGMTAIAVALNILVYAVKGFGNLNLEVLGKGLGAVAVSMASIGLSAKLFPGGMIQIGLGLLAISAGMNLLAKAVNAFGKLSLAVLAKGITAVGLSIAAIALGMKLMPKNLVVQAAGLLLISLSLSKISQAVSALGHLDVGTLAKGLGALGAAIAILAVGVRAMAGSASGALALSATSVALSFLAKAVIAMGKAGIATLAIGLGALAAALGILALAGVALEPVTPALLAFGAAIALIGAGVAGFGAGVDLIGKGLDAIGKAGNSAIGIMTKAINAIATTIPHIAEGLATGLVQMLTTIAKHGPEIINGFAKIIGDILDAIVKDAPKFGAAITAVIKALLKVLRDNAPEIIHEGILLIEQLLSGISNNIGKVTKQAADIVIKFLDALAQKAGQIIAAGATFLVKFLEGIATHIAKVAGAAGDIIAQFVTAVGRQAGKILTAGVNILVKFLAGVTRDIGKVAQAVGSIIVKFITEIGVQGARIIGAGAGAAAKFITSFSNGAYKIVSTAGKAILKFLTALDAAVTQYGPQIAQKGIDIGFNLIWGIIKGMANELPHLLAEAAHVILSLPGKFIHLLGIGSPSKVFAEIGKNVMLGLSKGIADDKTSLNAMSKAANSIIDTVKHIFKIKSPSQVMYDLGKYVSEGFTKGLHGSTTDITTVLNDFGDKLNTAIHDAKSAIAQATSSKDAPGVSKAMKTQYQDTINSENDLLNKLAQVHSRFFGGLMQNKKDLIAASKEYDKLSTQLQNAQSVLQQAQQAETDAVKGYEDSFSQLPALDTTVDPSQQANQYATDLATQVTNLKQYADVLGQLRKLGLDNATYMKLLNEGPTDLPFAQELLAAGQVGVNNINALDKQLTDTSDSLATTAGKSLYDAGVTWAQSIVDGITSSQKKVKDRMDNLASEITKGLDSAMYKKALASASQANRHGVNIGENLATGVASGITNKSGSAYKAVSDLADGMIATLKAKLQIKSPSTIFAEIGGNTAVGLANGLTSSQHVITDAVTGIGDSAIKTMQDTLNKASTVAMDHIDSNPVITPVLDLSEITKTAKQLNANPLNITAAASYDQAVTISKSTDKATAVDSTTTPTPILQFSQTNNSPKALSEIEIYRQTNNQLSQAKKMLTTK